MGIASPALFAAVLADGGRGPRGPGDVEHPADPAGRARAPARPWPGSSSPRRSAPHQIAAAEHAGAHVPAVVHAARLTYLAVAAVSAVGVVACFWLRRDVEAPGRAQERPAADVAEFAAADGGAEPAVRGAG